MSNNYDAFGDITDEDFGLLEGAAIQHLRRARTTPTAAGLFIEMPCGRCGFSVALTLDWPEVVSLKYGISPDRWLRAAPGDTIVGWSYGQDKNQAGQPVGPPSWRPNLQCKCGGHYPLRVRPDEPENWLKTARASRMLDPRIEASVSQQAAQMANPQQQQGQMLPPAQRRR